MNLVALANTNIKNRSTGPCSFKTFKRKMLMWQMRQNNDLE